MLFLQKQQGLVATKRKNFVFPASSSRCRHISTVDEGFDLEKISNKLKFGQITQNNV